MVYLLVFFMVFLLVVFMVFLLVVFMVFLLVVFMVFLLVVFVVFLEVKLVVLLVVVLVSGQSPPEVDSVAHHGEAELPEVGVGELRQHVVGNALFLEGGHQVLQALGVEESVEGISGGAVHSTEQDTPGDKYC